jgi:hypothetical protein
MLLVVVVLLPAPSGPHASQAAPLLAHCPAAGGGAVAAAQEWLCTLPPLQPPAPSRRQTVPQQMRQEGEGEGPAALGGPSGGARLLEHHVPLCRSLPHVSAE